MERHIEQAMRRTWRYWYVDGLSELATGCLLLLLAPFFMLDLWLPPGPAHAILWMLGLPATLVVGGRLLSRAVQAAKARLVYPRTGYVSYPRSRGRRLLLGAVVGVVMGAVVGVLAAAGPASQAWIPALQGLLLGSVWVYVGHRLDLTRFYLLAAISALAGVGAARSGLHQGVAMAAYFAVAGGALVASGLLTLSRYLRRTRALGEGQDHGP